MDAVSFCQRNMCIHRSEEIIGVLLGEHLCLLFYGEIPIQSGATSHCEIQSCTYMSLYMYVAMM